MLYNFGMKVIDSNKSGCFIHFSRTPLELNQKNFSKETDLMLLRAGIDFLMHDLG
ncbi:MAG: hypothetical protein ACJA2S_005009 [Cyclobacteriaceae bacterium]|jgi:hypothetical protein